MGIETRATELEFIQEKIEIRKIEFDPATGLTCIEGVTVNPHPPDKKLDPGTQHPMQKELSACFASLVMPKDVAVSELKTKIVPNQKEAVDQASPVFDNLQNQLGWGVVSHLHGGPQLKHDAANAKLAIEHDGIKTSVDYYLHSRTRPIITINAHRDKHQPPSVSPAPAVSAGSPIADRGYPRYIVTKLDLPATSSDPLHPKKD